MIEPLRRELVVLYGLVNRQERDSPSLPRHSDSPITPDFVVTCGIK
jgi:hypothetical protein